MKHIFTVLLLLLSCSSVFAHHSTNMFELNRQITLDATVKELEWTNPHAWLQVIVVNDEGEEIQWGLEMGTPAALMREGWRPRVLLPGDKVTVTLNPLKNGQPGGNLVRAVKADGTVLGKKN